MTRILTCVKYVPDTADDVDFEPDNSLDREARPGMLSELDGYAVEQSLQLRDQFAEARVSLVTMGPAPAAEALRKGLQMGADEAYLITDPALSGSDVFGTVRVLAAAARTLPEVGLVVCGMSSTDAEMGVLPALLARELGWPLLSMAAEVEVSGDSVQIRRLDEVGLRTVRADLPAVVSVTDQTGEPRYPSFRDVLAAKKKPIHELPLEELGLAGHPEQLGRPAARVLVDAISRNPDRVAGTVLVDDQGSSVPALVSFLADAARI